MKHVFILIKSFFCWQIHIILTMIHTLTNFPEWMEPSAVLLRVIILFHAQFNIDVTDSFECTYSIPGCAGLSDMHCMCTDLFAHFAYNIQ